MFESTTGDTRRAKIRWNKDGWWMADPVKENPVKEKKEYITIKDVVFYV